MMRCLATAALGGWLLSYAFPLVDLPVFAWISFVPLFYALDRARGPREGALFGWVFGIVFTLFDVQWIFGTLVTHGRFTEAPALVLFVVLVGFLGLFPATFGFLLVRIADRGFNAALAAPFIWTALEYIRSWAFTGFPWDLVGYSQASNLLLAQITDLTGVYGITFVVVLVNAAIWEVLRKVARSDRAYLQLPGEKIPRSAGPNKPAVPPKSWLLPTGECLRDRLPWPHIAVTAATVVAVAAYGTVRTADYPAYEKTGSSFSIGVLQANIAQEVKWAKKAREYTFLTYEKLGKQAVDQGAQLLVWPETSVPVLFGTAHPATARPGRISRRLRVPMLVGAPSTRTADGVERFFNSAFLLKSSSIEYRYDKIHLVPFGEYMPFSGWLPLGPGIASREGDYSPGEKMTVMTVPGCPPFSVLICYEVVFPSIARMALNSGARMLMNMTNDAWFGSTAAPYQHLNMARLRSIENRAWLIRCANTGVSAAFDPAGRLVESVPLNEEGFFVVNVPSQAHAGSVYSRFGDFFALGCLGSSLFLALAPLDATDRESRNLRFRQG